MNNVAIVILNWNGRNLLEKFLPSVVSHSGSARIIIADNASTDSSIEFLKSNYPTLEIVQNSRNEGFAKGYNEALKKVDAEFYVLLNSDVKVTEGWLSPLIDAISREDVAACQPKILSQTNTSYFEHAGAAGGFIDRSYYPFCRGRIFNHFEKDHQQYDSTREIFWATGACLMIKAKLFHSSGGFDDDFFAHMEEIDLCWRLKKMNYKILAIPSSTVYHLGGGTLPYSSPKKVYLNFRNNLIMISKNHEGLLFPKLIQRLCLDGIAGFQFLITGQINNFFSVIRAHFWHHFHLKSILTKRAAVKKQSTVFNPSGLYNGSIIWAYFVKGVKETSRLNQRLFR